MSVYRLYHSNIAFFSSSSKGNIQANCAIFDARISNLSEVTVLFTVKEKVRS
ncbi:hypothetical protein ALT1000_240025 [Alteromonas macleodii]